MKNNNISTSQGCQIFKMNNNNSRHNLKSNAIKNPQDKNFIPFENVDHDTFINVQEEDIIYHIIDEHDAQEWHNQDYPFTEFQRDINSHDEKEAHAYMNNTINNGEDAVCAEPCLLNPPIDHDFSCADFDIDYSYES